MQAAKGGKATSKDLCSTKPFFPFPFTSGAPGSASHILPSSEVTKSYKQTHSFGACNTLLA